ncbi:MAG: DUF1800 domain-containing protein [Planctomycetota bacterium]
MLFTSNDHRLKPYRPGQDGAFGRAEVAHLLGRTELGATAARAAKIEALGLSQALDNILAFDDAKESALYRRHLRLGSRIGRRQELSLLQAQWLQRFLSARRPLREHLALFWHDHFATSNFKVKDTVAMQIQNEIFRLGAAGPFDELLEKIARDPAMLTWLDNDSNTKVSPNENFARELFELFSLGLGNFDERDVKESARAFTGWGVKARRFHFEATQHDENPKFVLDRMGKLDGGDVLAAIAESGASDRFVATKLFRWFVRPDIDETLAAALGQLFADCERCTGPFLKRILGSRIFFEPASRAVLFRSPVQLVVAVLRTLNANVNAIELAKHCRMMGQDLFNPPSVEGWKGGRSWINSSALVARQNFGQALIEGEADSLKARSREETSALKPWVSAILTGGQAAIDTKPEKAPRLIGEGSTRLVGECLFMSQVHLF